MKNNNLKVILSILILVTLACAGGGATGGSSGNGVGNPGDGAGAPDVGAPDAGGAEPAGNNTGGEMPVTDFEGIPIDENGTISVSVTDEQVNQILLASQDSSEAEIEDAQVSFSNAGITLTGNVSGQSLYILYWPSVVNGSVHLEVIEARLGDVEVPEQILEEAETAVNQSLSEAMNQMPDAVTLQDIVVSDGLLTIFASVNQ